MEKKEVFRAFNKLYFEMLEFMNENVDDKNKSFKIFYRKNYLLKRANIKLFIKKWYENISILYYNEILDGNIDYFLNKDYNSDLEKTGELKNELSMGYHIEYMKNIYHSLDKKLVDKFVLYVQQITQLSVLYYKLQ